MTDEAKVIPLFRDGDRRLRPRTRQCRHNHADIDPDLRKLVCRDCGMALDAFDYLLKLAREEDGWRKARDAAERQARMAQQRVEDLRLEEKRAKGRLRRMRAQERDLERALARLEAELRERLANA